MARKGGNLRHIRRRRLLGTLGALALGSCGGSGDVGPDLLRRALIVAAIGCGQSAIWRRGSVVFMVIRTIPRPINIVTTTRPAAMT